MSVARSPHLSDATSIFPVFHLLKCCLFSVCALVLNGSFLSPEAKVLFCSESLNVYISDFMAVCVFRQCDRQPVKQIETNTHSL